MNYFNKFREKQKKFGEFREYEIFWRFVAEILSFAKMEISQVKFRQNIQN